MIYIKNTLNTFDLVIKKTEFVGGMLTLNQILSIPNKTAF